MASANVTISRAYDFEADATPRVATLRKPGGYIRASGAGAAFVNIDGGVAPTTAPGGANIIQLPGNGTFLYQLPNDCISFGFAAPVSTNITYIAVQN